MYLKAGVPVPLAKHVQNITKCGIIKIKANRGYVLLKIKNIVGLYTIVSLKIDYMRNPKIKAFPP